MKVYDIKYSEYYELELKNGDVVQGQYIGSSIRGNEDRTELGYVLKVTDKRAMEFIGVNVYSLVEGKWCKQVGRSGLCEIMASEVERVRRMEYSETLTDQQCRNSEEQVGGDYNAGVLEYYTTVDASKEAFLKRQRGREKSFMQGRGILPWEREV